MPGTAKLNKTITFGKDGKIRELDAYRFDMSEPSISCSQDEVAGFSFAMFALPPESGLRIIAGATPFIHAGHVSQQQFFIFVSGLYIGFRTLVVARKIDFVLPRNSMSPRGLRVEFVIPTAVSPKRLGISHDVCKLGIASQRLHSPLINEGQ